MEPDEDILDQEIDRWMRDRATPKPPASFTGGVMTRVRRERWRSEQYWDLGFNVAVAGGLLLVAVGVIGLVHVSGFTAVGRDAISLFAVSMVTLAERVAPSLPIYAASVALAMSALGLWWWAENS
jgi:hypothetical protein